MTSEARLVTAVWIVARKSDGEAMAVYANEADATEDVSIRHRRHRDRYKVEAWQVLGLPAAAPAEGLREALARAIEAGYTDESIDPDLYRNDPVFHAVVWEIRQHRAALARHESAGSE
jgi:hypothetical protein